MDQFGSVNSGCTSPAINVDVFPDRNEYFYWSITKANLDDKSSWWVYFNNGIAAINEHETKGNVRLVRGGQIFPYGIVAQDLRDARNSCISDFEKASSIYDYEQFITKCKAFDSRGLVAKAKSQIQVIIERDRKAKIEEEKWAAQACDRLYPGKPVKVSVQSNWGELFYRAVIVGVSARNGVASAKVTESGSYYGQIAERSCQSF